MKSKDNLLLLQRMTKTKLISYSIIGLFLLALAASFVLPNTYFVERTIVINAAKEKILYQLVNLNEWEDWNPWHETDPKAKIIYEGPTGAVGSRMSWEGPEMGVGEIEIIDIKTNSEIYFRFAVTEPMKLVGQGKLVVSPSTDHYQVSWTMYGPLSSPFERLLGFLLEQRLGSDFNRGLKNLKGFVELEKNPFEQSPPDSLLKTEQLKAEQEKPAQQPVQAPAQKKIEQSQNSGPGETKTGTLEDVDKTEANDDEGSFAAPDKPKKNAEGYSDESETVTTPMESEVTEPVTIPAPESPSTEEKVIPSEQIDYE